MVQTFPLDKANEAYGETSCLRLDYQPANQSQPVEAMTKGTVRFRAVITMD